jgi:hypothetical protein
MPPELVSPELALVDPDLAARTRAALPDPAPPHRPVPAARPAAASEAHHERHYPVWARITAALWLLVLGILVGGAAIPHAQDTPRVIPKDDDPVVTICEPEEPATPSIPGTSFPGGLNR